MLGMPTPITTIGIARTSASFAMTTTSVSSAEISSVPSRTTAVRTPVPSEMSENEPDHPHDYGLRIGLGVGIPVGVCGLLNAGDVLLVAPQTSTRHITSQVTNIRCKRVESLRRDQDITAFHHA
jgi:hypothetical protein